MKSLLVIFFLIFAFNVSAAEENSLAQKSLSGQKLDDVEVRSQLDSALKEFDAKGLKGPSLESLVNLIGLYAESLYVNGKKQSLVDSFIVQLESGLKKYKVFVSSDLRWQSMASTKKYLYEKGDPTVSEVYWRTFIKIPFLMGDARNINSVWIKLVESLEYQGLIEKGYQVTSQWAKDAKDSQGIRFAAIYRSAQIANTVDDEAKFKQSAKRALTFTNYGQNSWAQVLTGLIAFYDDKYPECEKDLTLAIQKGIKENVLEIGFFEGYLISCLIMGGNTKKAENRINSAEFQALPKNTIDRNLLKIRIAEKNRDQAYQLCQNVLSMIPPEDKFGFIRYLAICLAVKNPQQEASKEIKDLFNKEKTILTRLAKDSVYIRSLMAYVSLVIETPTSAKLPEIKKQAMAKFGESSTVRKALSL